MDLIKKEKIVDHGVLKDNDELRRRSTDFEGYRVEPEVMTVLRKMVGVDLLREEAVSYLPAPGEIPTYRKPKPSERGSPAPSISASLRSRPSYGRRPSSPVINKRKRSSLSSHQTEDGSTISYSDSENEGGPKKKPRNSLFLTANGRQPATAGRKSGGKKLKSDNAAYKPGGEESSDDDSSDGAQATRNRSKAEKAEKEEKVESAEKAEKEDADPADFASSVTKPKSKKRRRDTDGAYQPKEDPSDDENEDLDRRKSKRRKSTKRKPPGSRAASPAPETNSPGQSAPVTVGGD